MEISDLRFFIVAGAFALFALLESVFSYRERKIARFERWSVNLPIIVIGTFLVRLIFPLGLWFVSIKTETTESGLLGSLALDYWLEVLLTILILDFAIYVQHVFAHKVPLFWRFHKVHHSDRELDVTSALRFHPIEIFLSFAYKALIVFIFGFKIEMVLIFEIVLNFMAMFNHSNLSISKGIESKLRLLFVTPQMHLIHHSVDQTESDSNYGFNLSIWDRVFSTYVSKFKGEIMIGQKDTNSKAKQSLWYLLRSPFLKTN